MKLNFHLGAMPLLVTGQPEFRFHLQVVCLFGLMADIRSLTDSPPVLLLIQKDLDGTLRASRFTSVGAALLKERYINEQCFKRKAAADFWHN